MAEYLRQLTNVPDATIAQIERVVGLDYMGENGPNYYILDGSLPDKGLYILHHSKTADSTYYGEVRGMVVDLNLERVVRRTFGKEPQTGMDVIPEEGSFDIIGDDGVRYLVDESSDIVRGIDGLLLSVMYNNGSVLIGSHKFVEIRGTKSRSGGVTYETMLSEMGGINTEELFDTTKLYSPYVHYFMLAHGALQVASKTTENLLGLWYLGARRMWGKPIEADLPERSKGLELSAYQQRPDISSMNIDVEHRAPEALIFPGKERLSGQYFKQTPLSRKLANLFLKSGDYDLEDAPYYPTLSPGEYVMIYMYESDGRVRKTIRINSSSYLRRRNLFDAAGTWDNMEHTFYTLLDVAIRNTSAAAEASSPGDVDIHEYESTLTPEERVAIFNSPEAHKKRRYFINKEGKTPNDEIWDTRNTLAGQIEDLVLLLPPLNMQQMHEMSQKGDLIWFSEGKDISLPFTAGEMVYNLWLNFVLSAPLPKAMKAFSLLSTYQEGLKALAWFSWWYRSDTESLQSPEENFKSLSSFMLLVKNMVSKEGEATPSLVENAVIDLSTQIDGKTLFRLTKIARRTYYDKVVHRGLWLAKSGLLDAEGAMGELTAKLREVSSDRDTFRSYLGFLPLEDLDQLAQLIERLYTAETDTMALLYREGVIDGDVLEEVSEELRKDIITIQVSYEADLASYGATTEEEDLKILSATLRSVSVDTFEALADALRKDVADV